VEIDAKSTGDLGLSGGEKDVFAYVFTFFSKVVKNVLQ